MRKIQLVLEKILKTMEDNILIILIIRAWWKIRKSPIYDKSLWEIKCLLNSVKDNKVEKKIK